MLIIPAIDIKNGKCVRLRQGRMSDETIFSDQPDEMARKWFDCGAERLHLVDLDGAVSGRPANRKTIRSIVEAVPVPVELGGGVRDMETLHAYFDLGLQYIILGTVAHKNPDFVKKACRLYPGRIILGIDARNNRVAVEGWTEEINLTPAVLADRFKDDGLAAIIYTDINRDGMRTGCNVAATGALARRTTIPIIASGGISELDDVLKILPLSADGVMGIITGRALYDGSLDLVAAIKACR
ncbi:MAG: 1-(5-phosphoribosyl)-5-[(5-phosphoribosylamino)methylideneamino]imidazole-4-carboxamide isomerase [Deltaproteobacteria bacterium]|nr:1-(5-phosphoribosyl)-5-[(5-phosphoribosylamino)methylideneamino]imidazole-4-carboxamide isomerase [Deltaproteobacteria bacterium]